LAHLGKWTDNSRKASRKRSKREARWSGLRKTTSVLSEKSTQLVSATKDVAHNTSVALKDRTAAPSGSGRRMFVMTIAAALVGTVALPAYAMSPEAPQNDTYYSNFASQDTQNVDNTSEAPFLRHVMDLPPQLPFVSSRRQVHRDLLISSFWLIRPTLISVFPEYSARV